MFLDRARRLFEDPGHLSGGHGQFALSLLVARLAAHEIGHVVLGTLSHTRTGLMRTVFDSNDGWAQPDACYMLSPSDQAVARRNLAGREIDRIARRVEPVWPR